MSSNMHSYADVVTACTWLMADKERKQNKHNKTYRVWNMADRERKTTITTATTAKLTECGSVSNLMTRFKLTG